MTPADPTPGAVAAHRLLLREGVASDGARTIPEETPVALVHDASTTAVMMATPLDLEDFAAGFSLTEGIISTLDEIRNIEVAGSEQGIEARVWLRADRSAELASRRRRLAGATGCGLCGIDSLEEAVRKPRLAGEGVSVSWRDIHAAFKALQSAQALGAATRAVHAAGWQHDGGILVREDVGRHNALDKLAGARLRAGVTGGDGVLLLTSRVSVEMVQKAAAMGAQVLAAISAPTALAVRTAKAAGITLIAVARDDSFEVFNRPDRVRR